MPEYFSVGSNVLIHSLGNNTPGEFKAVVKGHGFYHASGCVYILEMIDRLVSWEEYPYTHIMMVSACVKENKNVK